MRNKLVFAIICLFAAISVAPAMADIAYDVTVNTSSINGQTGTLDFTFASGLSSQPATVTISNFVSAGVLSGMPLVSGNVTGTLPSDVVMGNDPGYNDYFDTFVFGPQILFTLTFSGDAVNFPDGISDPNAFAFSILDDTGTMPLLPVTDPDGFLFRTDIGNNGVATNSAFSDLVTIRPSAGPPQPGVPEPAGLLLLAAGLAAVRLLRKH